MKGTEVELFSDIFLLFALAAMTVLIVTFIYYAWIAYSIESYLGDVGTRRVALTLFFYPVKYDSTFLTFLELTDNGVPMKDLLTLAAIQEDTEIWYNGENIDVSDISKEFLDDMLDRPYLLKISNPEVIIASSGELSTRLQKMSTKLFDFDGDPILLELYVD